MYHVLLLGLVHELLLSLSLHLASSLSLVFQSHFFQTWEAGLLKVADNVILLV